ncbi:MAG: hypothetical protein V5A41_00575 [Haloarculaceae archaeon]
MVSGPRALLVLSLVVLSVVAVVPGMASTGPTDSQSQTTGELSASQTMVVDLQQNGDARWTVTKTFTLSSRNETEAFDEVASDFEDGQTDDLGLAAYQRASQLASDSTNREMAITDITRESSRTGTATNGTGQLSISFTWTNFGRIESDTFHVDDVFATSPRWLDGLSADQQLIVIPPDGYRFFDASVSVTLRNGTIQWTGPRDFTDTPLSATFEQTGDIDPGTTTPGVTTGTTAPTPGGSNTSSFLWLGLATLGAVLVGYLLVRDGDILDAPGGGSEPSTDSPDSGPTAPATPATDESTTGEAIAESGEESESDTIDEELLSDEERVERLLEQNGGRMKQANIVKETNWSNAKVSQLLSSMEEAGEIDKLRIGRENLISFPDEDITDLEE